LGKICFIHAIPLLTRCFPQHSICITNNYHSFLQQNKYICHTAIQPCYPLQTFWFTGTIYKGPLLQKWCQTKVGRAVSKDKRMLIRPHRQTEQIKFSTIHLVSQYNIHITTELQHFARKYAGNEYKLYHKSMDMSG
jgi:hypothetical protein